MYLDYESFVDCLIKSGYTKKCSDLITEIWSSGIDHLEIIIDGDIVVGIETFEVSEGCGITYQSVGKSILLSNYT